MDIAIIAPPWLPVPAPAYGGTEAVLDVLARGLQAAGHEVLLICHPDSQCPVPKASVVPAEDAVPMGRSSIELEHVIGAYELVKDCDVVHDNTLAGPIYSARYPKPAGGHHQSQSVQSQVQRDLRSRRSPRCAGGDLQLARHVHTPSRRCSGASRPERRRLPVRRRRRGLRGVARPNGREQGCAPRHRGGEGGRLAIEDRRQDARTPRACLLRSIRAAAPR